MKTRALILLALLLSSFVENLHANESDVRKDTDEPSVTQTLRKMRIRQEGEETRVIRVIGQFNGHGSKGICSPIQQTRQRLRDVGRGKKNGTGQDIGTLIIDAGNDNMTIDGNAGEIQNNINMNVEVPNENRCL